MIIDICIAVKDETCLQHLGKHLLNDFIKTFLGHGYDCSILWDCHHLSEIQDEINQSFFAVAKE